MIIRNISLLETTLREQNRVKVRCCPDFENMTVYIDRLKISHLNLALTQNFQKVRFKYDAFSLDFFL